MALRAGYYGIKKKLRDKLSDIASLWDNVIEFIYPVDGTITPAEGITLESSSYLHKQGNIINGYIAVNGVTATTSTVIATLPTGFKPAAALTLVGVNTSDNAILPFFVFGNGEVKLAVSVTNKNIRLPITFMDTISTAKTINVEGILEPDSKELVKEEITEELVVEKKTTTKKKSTAKAETQEEV